jgi:hypothetical protein
MLLLFSRVRRLNLGLPFKAGTLFSTYNLLRQVVKKIANRAAERLDASRGDAQEFFAATRFGRHPTMLRIDLFSRLDAPDSVQDITWP